MLNLTRPQYVMPVHGDFKRVRIHSQLAQAVGVPPENIFQGENGLPLEITASGASWGERETAGMIFVDGVDIGDVADVALRDRRMLQRRRDLHHRRDRVRAGRLVRRRARGPGARRAVPRRKRGVRRRPPRGGRGLPGPSRVRADHRDRRARSRCSTTTSRASSTTSSSGARWCCRSSSRSQRSPVSNETSRASGGRWRSGATLASWSLLRRAGCLSRRPRRAPRATTTISSVPAPATA